MTNTNIGSSPTSLEQAAPSVIQLALRDFTPFAAALIPFAMAIGTAASVNGLTLPQAAFGAVFLLAGTAQLATIELIGSDTGATVVVANIASDTLLICLCGALSALSYTDNELLLWSVNFL